MTTHSLNRRIRDYFELRVHQKSGVEFQNFFGDIMVALYPNFTKIVSYVGDGGNDGYISTEKRYYQVYAPAPSTSLQSIASYATRKLVADYNKLKNKWGVILHFHFVLNDRMQGIDPRVAFQLEQIKSSDANLLTAEVIGMNRLYEIFSQLPTDKQMLIVEFTPLEETGVPNYEYLTKILVHFLDMAARSNCNSPLVAPQLEEKIKFNGFDQEIHDRILNNCRYVADVENYFVSSPDEEQKVAALLRNIYYRVKNDIQNYCANSSAIRYHEMIRYMLPSYVTRLAQEEQKRYYYAAEIIFAKYFESCDVFESPLGTDSE